MSAAVALKPVEGNPSLDPNRGRAAQSERNVWRYYPEPKHTKEQVLHSDYLAHVSRQHRIGDRIELLWEDGSAYAELLVVACDKNWTRTHLLSFHNLTDRALKGDSLFEVQWKGSMKKHCVVRLSDNAVIHEGAQTKTDAEEWLRLNRATLA